LFTAAITFGLQALIWVVISVAKKGPVPAPQWVQWLIYGTTTAMYAYGMFEIWRRISWRNVMNRAVAPLILAFAGAWFLSFAAAELISNFSIAAIWLLAFSAILGWWGWLARGVRKPISDEMREDIVRCPVCDYSMAGLREAKCPECGSEFTLDQLVAGQEHLQSSPILKNAFDQLGEAVSEKVDRWRGVDQDIRY
jgi:hypothetical protein